MRILLAIDDSPHSRAAVEAVANRPWPAGSVVRVLHAIEPIIGPEVALYYAVTIEHPETTRRLRQHAEEITSSAAERLASANLTVEQQVREQDPRLAIIDEASEWGADLIVLGSHGYTGLRRLILGSVSQYVVSHATSSVEVVRLPKHEMNH
jgi:nucleotide-binding universal stress UspA family protein